MSINRHNYEEFFILYLDNELSAGERAMVDTFVQQHPDLKEELDILLQYKLEPDQAIRFRGKDDLFKVNGETAITLTNYEEWLVAYIDNELPAHRMEELNALMDKNAFIRSELGLLQKTKIQPEVIVFPGKASLYRKEEKRRIVPFPYRWVAAAILILALGITAVVLFTGGSKNVTGKGEMVSTNPGKNNQTGPVPKDQPTDKVVENNSKEEQLPGKTNEIATHTADRETRINNKNNIQPVTAKIPENKVATLNQKNTSPDKITTVTNIQDPLKKDAAILVDNKIKPSNHLPEATNNPNVTGESDLANNSSNKSIESPEVTIPRVISSNKSNPDIKTASQNDNDNAERLEEGNNKKSRGLFRKIARTFEKRTNLTATDDNRLLVAGLSFKLK